MKATWSIADDQVEYRFTPRREGVEIYECETCGSLVPVDRVEDHVGWHASLLHAPEKP